MNATETVYTEIRRRLLTSFYDPGTQLKEEVLATEFNVSRTPIRAAISSLISEGLLTQGEKRGATVTAWHVENTSDVFQLRILLEGYGAYLCAKNASEDHIARMEQICTEMEEAHLSKRPDWIKVMDRGNLKFHEMLYEGAGSPHLRLSGRHLLEVPMVIGGFYIYNDDDVEESLRQHREITKAIRLGNGDWARSMVSCHLNAAIERFRRRRAVRN